MIIVCCICKINKFERGRTPQKYCSPCSAEAYKDGDRNRWNRTKNTRNKKRRIKYKLTPEKEIKELNQKRYRKYYERYSQKSKEYYEEHKYDKDFKRKRNKRKLAYYYRNKTKDLARSKLGKAVLRGKIIKPDKCSNCQEIKRIEGHHPDYTKPLDVIWLCKKCHERLHHPAQLLSRIKARLEH